MKRSLGERRNLTYIFEALLRSAERVFMGNTPGFTAGGRDRFSPNVLSH